jgi:hypothetical protein
MMHTFILLAGAHMFGFFVRTQSSSTARLWYHVLHLLGEHIPIRVNIKHVQTQLHIRVLLHVTAGGRDHNKTAIVQPTGNVYHDRIFDQFRKGKTSKREEEINSYIRANLQML